VKSIFKITRTNIYITNKLISKNDIGPHKHVDANPINRLLFHATNLILADEKINRSPNTSATIFKFCNSLIVGFLRFTEYSSLKK
jgi:hypothetical protein